MPATPALESGILGGDRAFRSERAAGEEAADEEVLYRRRGSLVQRMRLEPGESSPWHVDDCERVTVVLSGERLTIEMKEGGDALDVPMHPGLVGWGEPTTAVHRAVNSGSSPYEDVVTFFLDRPDQDPQPTFG